MSSITMISGKGLNNELEDELVRASQRGDREAFNQLVLSYQDRIYSLAVRLLNDMDTADDIAQNTFLTAYLNLHRFRNGSFRSWIYRIATNLCYDEHRRYKRYPVLPLENKETKEEKLLPLSDFASYTVLPEREVERRESAQVIQDALTQLDPVQRTIVILVDLQEMDYQEAADVLRIPVGTVKSRLARARLKLRQLLGDSRLVN